MKVLYRADGGHQVGTGHIFRAVRVLKALAAKSELDAHLVVGGDESAVRIASTAPASIVQVPGEFDSATNKPVLKAAPLLNRLRLDGFDLLVIDMLDTPAEEMELLASIGVPIVSFDDRGPGRIQAASLINILIAEPAPDSLPARIRLFEGGAYVALDPIFAASCGSYAGYEPMRKVFVSMGGSDAAGLTVKVARALRNVSGLEQAAFTAGPAFAHREELEKVVADAPWQATILPPQPNLLGCYLDCDLAIIAGGLTMYEVCCVGVPALAVCQSIDHQLELSARLADAGAMATAGEGAVIGESEIANAVDNLSPVGVRAGMSAIGPKLVDGRGCERIADILIDIAGRPVQ